MYNRVMGTLILVALFISLAAYASLTFKQANHLNDANIATISVSGTSEVLSKPDIAQFSFSVRGEGIDAATAQEKSATAINAITTALKTQGIDDKDIKTENYYLSPKYKYIQAPCVFGAVCPPGQQTADGFEVSQTITVKVRKTDTAGAILTQVGTLGATDISNLSFTVDDIETVKAQARDLAIADAKAKAEKLAASLGVHLVRITSFSENNMSGGYGYAPMADSAMGVKSAAAPTPAVPTGENKTVGNVTLTFEVR
jgi:hypothetical protein